MSYIRSMGFLKKISGLNIKGEVGLGQPGWHPGFPGGLPGPIQQGPGPIGPNMPTSMFPTHTRVGDVVTITGPFGGMVQGQVRVKFQGSYWLSPQMMGPATASVVVPEGAENGLCEVEINGRRVFGTNCIIDKGVERVGRPSHKGRDVRAWTQRGQLLGGSELIIWDEETGEEKSRTWVDDSELAPQPGIISSLFDAFKSIGSKTTTSVQRAGTPSQIPPWLPFIIAGAGIWWFFFRTKSNPKDVDWEDLVARSKVGWKPQAYFLKFRDPRNGVMRSVRCPTIGNARYEKKKLLERHPNLTIKIVKAKRKVRA